MINNFVLNLEIYDWITIIYVVAGITLLCGEVQVIINLLSLATKDYLVPKKKLLEKHIYFK